MTISFLILFALVGLLAGSLSGLLGIGGGVVIVPILTFLFGFSEHLAQGTTLALMVPPIGLLAAWQYYRRGYVNLRIAALVCTGFLFGGLLGARLANDFSNHMLEKVFGVALVLIASKILLGRNERSDMDARQPYTTIRLLPALMFVLLGLVGGAASGLIGIGGGVLIVPALVYLFGLSQHEAQGTTLALMVPPIGILAAWEYYQQGNVNIWAGAAICAGFFLGALLGAHLAGRMGNRILAKVFGIAMLLIAAKMLIS